MCMQKMRSAAVVDADPRIDVRKHRHFCTDVTAPSDFTRFLIRLVKMLRLMVQFILPKRF